MGDTASILPRIVATSINPKDAYISLAADKGASELEKLKGIIARFVKSTSGQSYDPAKVVADWQAGKASVIFTAQLIDYLLSNISRGEEQWLTDEILSLHGMADADRQLGLKQLRKTLYTYEAVDAYRIYNLAAKDSPEEKVQVQRLTIALTGLGESFESRKTFFRSLIPGLDKATSQKQAMDILEAYLKTELLPKIYIEKKLPETPAVPTATDPAKKLKDLQLQHDVLQAYLGYASAATGTAEEKVQEQKLSAALIAVGESLETRKAYLKRLIPELASAQTSAEVQSIISKYIANTLEPQIVAVQDQVKIPVVASRRSTEEVPRIVYTLDVINGFIKDRVLNGEALSADAIKKMQDNLVKDRDMTVNPNFYIRTMANVLSGKIVLETYNALGQKNDAKLSITEMQIVAQVLWGQRSEAMAAQDKINALGQQLSKTGLQLIAADPGLKAKAKWYIDNELPLPPDFIYTYADKALIERWSLDPALESIFADYKKTFSEYTNTVDMAQRKVGGIDLEEFSGLWQGDSSVLESVMGRMVAGSYYESFYLFDFRAVDQETIHALYLDYATSTGFTSHLLEGRAWSDKYYFAQFETGKWIMTPDFLKYIMDRGHVAQDTQRKILSALMNYGLAYTNIKEAYFELEKTTGLTIVEIKQTIRKAILDSQASLPFGWLPGATALTFAQDAATIAMGRDVVLADVLSPWVKPFADVATALFDPAKTVRDQISAGVYSLSLGNMDSLTITKRIFDSLKPYQTSEAIKANYADFKQTITTVLAELKNAIASGKAEDYEIIVPEIMSLLLFAVNYAVPNAQEYGELKALFLDVLSKLPAPEKVFSDYAQLAASLKARQYQGEVATEDIAKLSYANWLTANRQSIQQALQALGGQVVLAEAKPIISTLNALIPELIYGREADKTAFKQNIEKLIKVVKKDSKLIAYLLNALGKGFILIGYDAVLTKAFFDALGVKGAVREQQIAQLQLAGASPVALELAKNIEQALAALAVEQSLQAQGLQANEASLAQLAGDLQEALKQGAVTYSPGEVAYLRLSYMDMDRLANITGYAEAKLFFDALLGAQLGDPKVSEFISKYTTSFSGTETVSWTYEQHLQFLGEAEILIAYLEKKAPGSTAKMIPDCTKALDMRHIILLRNEPFLNATDQASVEKRLETKEKHPRLYEDYTGAVALLNPDGVFNVSAKQASLVAEKYADFYKYALGGVDWSNLSLVKFFNKLRMIPEMSVPGLLGVDQPQDPYGQEALVVKGALAPWRKVMEMGALYEVEVPLQLKVALPIEFAKEIWDAIRYMDASMLSNAGFTLVEIASWRGLIFNWLNKPMDELSEGDVISFLLETWVALSLGRATLKKTVDLASLKKVNDTLIRTKDFMARLFGVEQVAAIQSWAEEQIVIKDADTGAATKMSKGLLTYYLTGGRLTAAQGGVAKIDFTRVVTAGHNWKWKDILKKFQAGDLTSIPQGLYKVLVSEPIYITQQFWASISVSRISRLINDKLYGFEFSKGIIRNGLDKVAFKFKHSIGFKYQGRSYTVFTPYELTLAAKRSAGEQIAAYLEQLAKTGTLSPASVREAAQGFWLEQAQAPRGIAREADIFFPGVDVHTGNAQDAVVDQKGLAIMEAVKPYDVPRSQLAELKGKWQGEAQLIVDRLRANPGLPDDQKLALVGELMKMYSAALYEASGEKYGLLRAQMATDYEVIKGYLNGKDVVAAELVAGGGKTITGIVGMRVLSDLMSAGVIPKSPIIYVVPRASLLEEVKDEAKPEKKLLDILFPKSTGGYGVVESVEQSFKPGTINYVALDTLFFKFITNPDTIPNDCTFIWDEFDKYFFLDSDFISTAPSAAIPWMQLLDKLAGGRAIKDTAESLTKKLGEIVTVADAKGGAGIYVAIDRIISTKNCQNVADVYRALGETVLSKLTPAERSQLDMLTTAVFRARGAYGQKNPVSDSSNIHIKNGRVFLAPGGEGVEGLRLNWMEHIFLKYALDAIPLPKGMDERGRMAIDGAEINSTLMKIGMPHLFVNKAKRIIGMTGTLAESMPIIKPLLDQLSTLKNRVITGHFFKSPETFPTIKLSPEQYAAIKAGDQKTIAGILEAIRVRRELYAGSFAAATVKIYVDGNNTTLEVKATDLELLREKLSGAGYEIKVEAYRGITSSLTREASLEKAASAAVDSVFLIDAKTNTVTLKGHALLDWNMLGAGDVQVLRIQIILAILDKLAPEFAKDYRAGKVSLAEVEAKIQKININVDFDNTIKLPDQYQDPLITKKTITIADFLKQIIVDDIGALGIEKSVNNIKTDGALLGRIIILSWANRGTDFKWLTDPYVGIVGVVPKTPDLIQIIKRGARFEKGATIDYFISDDDVRDYIKMLEPADYRSADDNVRALITAWDNYLKAKEANPQLTAKDFIVANNHFIQDIEANRASAMNQQSIDTLQKYGITVGVGARNYSDLYKASLSKYIDLVLKRYTAAGGGASGIEAVKKMLRRIGLPGVEIQKTLKAVQAHPDQAEKILTEFIIKYKGLEASTISGKTDMQRAMYLRSVSEKAAEQAQKKYKQYAGFGEEAKRAQYEEDIIRLILRTGGRQHVYELGEYLALDTTAKAKSARARIINATIIVRSAEDVEKLQDFYAQLPESTRTMFMRKTKLVIDGQISKDKVFELWPGLGTEQVFTTVTPVKESEVRLEETVRDYVLANNRFKDSLAKGEALLKIERATADGVERIVVTIYDKASGLLSVEHHFDVVRNADGTVDLSRSMASAVVEGGGVYRDYREVGGIFEQAKPVALGDAAGSARVIANDVPSATPVVTDPKVLLSGTVVETTKVADAIKLCMDQYFSAHPEIPRTSDSEERFTADFLKMNNRKMDGAFAKGETYLLPPAVSFGVRSSADVRAVVARSVENMFSGTPIETRSRLIQIITDRVCALNGINNAVGPEKLIYIPTEAGLMNILRVSMENSKPTDAGLQKEVFNEVDKAYTQVYAKGVSFNPYDSCGAFYLGFAISLLTDTGIMGSVESLFTGKALGGVTFAKYDLSNPEDLATIFSNAFGSGYSTSYMAIRDDLGKFLANKTADIFYRRLERGLSGTAKDALYKLNPTVKAFFSNYLVRAAGLAVMGSVDGVVRTIDQFYDMATSTDPYLQEVFWSLMIVYASKEAIANATAFELPGLILQGKGGVFGVIASVGLTKLLSYAIDGPVNTLAVQPLIADAQLRRQYMDVIQKYCETHKIEFTEEAVSSLLKEINGDKRKFLEIFPGMTEADWKKFISLKMHYPKQLTAEDIDSAVNVMKGFKFGTAVFTRSFNAVTSSWLAKKSATWVAKTALKFGASGLAEGSLACVPVLNILIAVDLAGDLVNIGRDALNPLSISLQNVIDANKTFVQSKDRFLTTSAITSTTDVSMGLAQQFLALGYFDDIGLTEWVKKQGVSSHQWQQIKEGVRSGDEAVLSNFIRNFFNKISLNLADLILSLGGMPDSEYDDLDLFLAGKSPEMKLFDTLLYSFYKRFMKEVVVDLDKQIVLVQQQLTITTDPDQLAQLRSVLKTLSDKKTLYSGKDLMLNPELVMLLFAKVQQHNIQTEAAMAYAVKKEVSCADGLQLVQVFKTLAEFGVSDFSEYTALVTNFKLRTSPMYAFLKGYYPVDSLSDENLVKLMVFVVQLNSDLQYDPVLKPGMTIFLPRQAAKEVEAAPVMVADRVETAIKTIKRIDGIIQDVVIFDLKDTAMLTKFNLAIMDVRKSILMDDSKAFAIIARDMHITEDTGRVKVTYNGIILCDFDQSYLVKLGLATTGLSADNIMLLLRRTALELVLNYKRAFIVSPGTRVVPGIRGAYTIEVKPEEYWRAEEGKIADLDKAIAAIRPLVVSTDMGYLNALVSAGLVQRDSASASIVELRRASYEVTEVLLHLSEAERIKLIKSKGLNKDYEAQFIKLVNDYAKKYQGVYSEYQGLLRVFTNSKAQPLFKGVPEGWMKVPYGPLYGYDETEYFVFQNKTDKTYQVYWQDADGTFKLSQSYVYDPKTTDICFLADRTIVSATKAEGSLLDSVVLHQPCTIFRSGYNFIMLLDDAGLRPSDDWVNSVTGVNLFNSGSDHYLEFLTNTGEKKIFKLPRNAYMIEQIRKYIGEIRKASFNLIEDPYKVGQYVLTQQFSGLDDTQYKVAWNAGKWIVYRVNPDKTTSLSSLYSYDPLTNKLVFKSATSNLVPMTAPATAKTVFTSVWARDLMRTKLVDLLMRSGISLNLAAIKTIDVVFDGKNYYIVTTLPISAVGGPSAVNITMSYSIPNVFNKDLATAIAAANSRPRIEYPLGRGYNM